MSLAIWCDAKFNEAAAGRLREGIRNHRGTAVLSEAEVAFGKPPPAECVQSLSLRWVQTSTAGYGPYDTEELREAFRARGAILTNSSTVYADTCAQHVLAMMLAVGRELLGSYRDQLTDHSWNSEPRRVTLDLLTGQTVLFLGYGAIGRRLTELLAPFRCNLYAVRRRIRSERGVRIIPEEDLTRVLALADHVVDLLPDNPTTRGWMNARRLSCCRPGARFYNVGRGTTVDQRALGEALASGRLGAAYLDVTDPEPLPTDDPLWTAPRCYITAHTGGGWKGRDLALVEHFLANLAAFERNEPLADRII